MSKTVNELVKLNEQAVWTEAAKLENLTDPIAKPIRILANAYAYPSFGAELELWVASRSDPNLRKALRTAEKDAVEDHDRVLAKLFQGVLNQSGGPKAISLTIEFVRGLAVSSLLRNDPRLRDRLIDDWIETVRNLLKSETK